MNDFEISENSACIKAQSGISLTSLSLLALKNNLSGLEFATGIPGSLGGALKMNAGAYDSQISDLVECVYAYSKAKETILKLKKEDIKFSYRHSLFMNEDYVILSSELNLKKDSEKNIKNRIFEYQNSRISKQPLEFHSAGSVFKKPSKDFHVGKVIEELGLKGFSIGDAKISEKHAGFIINTNKASFYDVISIIEIVKQRIFSHTGVELETEIEIWK